MSVCIQQKWKCKCIEGFWALIISGGCKINYSTSVNLTQPQGCTRTHTHNTHLQFGHCFTKSTCHHSRTSPLQAFDMSLVYLLKHTGWFILILNGPGFHYHSICSIQIKAKKNENDARLSPWQLTDIPVLTVSYSWRTVWQTHLSVTALQISGVCKAYCLKMGKNKTKSTGDIHLHCVYIANRIMNNRTSFRMNF